MVQQQQQHSLATSMILVTNKDGDDRCAISGLKFKIGIFMYVYVCIYGLVFRVPTPPTPPNGTYRSPVDTPFQAIGSISEVQPRIC